jgi:sugar/nucleoside kinase (ribokinase family)
MDPAALLADPGTPPRVLVVGGASLDTLVVRGAPTPSAGGAGLYTALAAARAGAGVTMLAPRPRPVPGALSPALERIAWVGPEVSPDRLPRFEIAYGPSGEVVRFDEFMGAEPEMRPQLLDGIDDATGWAYAVPFLDAELQLEFVRALRGRGALVAAGTYGRAVRAAPETVRTTMAEADAFFCNEDEAAVLFGAASEPTAPAGRLLFVTRGAAGATVHQGDHRSEIPGITVDALDPTGAGDTFCGTTLARLAAGDHPVEAARAGVAASAEQVTGVGPERLLRPPPGPTYPTAPVAAVRPRRVEALAELIAGLDELRPFPFAGDLFPPPGHAAALDFFFSATLQQFGFWREDAGHWVEPMIAPLGGRRLKGSDYLWAAYLRWMQDEPAGLTPGGQRAVTGASFSQRLADDAGRDPLPASEWAAHLAAAFGSTMTRLGWTPQDVVRAASSAARPMEALLRLLDHIGGYREDPLRKKSALLGVILRQRPERWLRDAPGDDAPPIVDYHVQRTCLRTGIVEIADPQLGERVGARSVVSARDEDAIRRACRDAVAGLVSASGRSMGTVDWFLFGMRRRCPETETPDCPRCPARPACEQRVDLFQPVRRTTFY